MTVESTQPTPGLEPAPAPGQVPAPTNEPGSKPETFSREYVEELRRENAARRKAEQDAAAERDRLAAQIAEHEKSQLSEKERAERERDEAQAAAKTAAERAASKLLRAEVVFHAGSLGFVDPDDALALLDRSQITFDDQGDPQGVKKALEQLATAKPHLLGGGGSGSPANPGGRRAGARVYTESEIADPKFYREHRADILAAGREGRIKAG